MALLRAARSHSPDRGCHFLTYASSAIRNAVIDAIRPAYPMLQPAENQSADDAAMPGKDSLPQQEQAPEV